MEYLLVSIFVEYIFLSIQLHLVWWNEFLVDSMLLGLIFVYILKYYIYYIYIEYIYMYFVYSWKAEWPKKERPIF